MLSAGALRSGLAATRALVPAATSPMPVAEAAPQHLTPVTPRADSPYRPSEISKFGWRTLSRSGGAETAGHTENDLLNHLRHFARLQRLV